MLQEILMSSSALVPYPTEPINRLSKVASKEDRSTIAELGPGVDQDLSALRLTTWKTAGSDKG